MSSFRELFPHVGASEQTLRAWVREFVAPGAARPDVEAVKYRRKSASRRISSFDDLVLHAARQLDHILAASPSISLRDLAAALGDCNVEVTANQRCLLD